MHKNILGTLGEVAGENYDALVLQGGGCRCFFTLGFLEAAGGSAALRDLRQIATVSASAAMATAHLLGTHRASMELFARHVGKNPKNFYPERILRGERPTPHHAMYREALLEALPPSSFQAILAHPTQLRVLVCHSRLRSWGATVGVAAACMLLARHVPGLAPHVIKIESLSSHLDLVDAVLASSAFPPFTPLPIRDGRLIIDGGAVAPIPFLGIDKKVARRPLAILTRPYPVRPLPLGTRFIAPQEELGIAIWQYADEPSLRRVYELGLRTGERFLRDGRVSCVL